MFSHQSTFVPLTQQQPPSVDFTSAPIDQALVAAQLHAARAQNEMDALAKKVRADRIALEQPWKDPRFFPITLENVMFYFCQRENPFFDPSSDNALILMQNQGIGPAQLDTVLKAMTGTQFVLVEPCAPPLFLVRKQQRNGPDKITPLCHYYVLDGTVYQAPDMHTLLHSRLIGVMDPLRCAFQEAVSMLRFTPARGHFWEFRTRPARHASAAAATDETEPNGDELDAFDEKFDTEMSEAGHKRTPLARGGDPMATRATPYQNQRTHALLAALAMRFNDSERKAAGQNAVDGRGDGTTKMMQKTDSPQPMSVDCLQQTSSVAFSASLISDFQGLLFSSSFPKQQQQQQHSLATNGEGQRQPSEASGE